MKKILSFKEVQENRNELLAEMFTKYDTLSYLVKERGVSPQHLLNLMAETGLTIEEFEDKCDFALTLETRFYGDNDTNPYGLMGNGNSKKARCEVRDDD